MAIELTQLEGIGLGKKAISSFESGLENTEKAISKKAANPTINPNRALEFFEKQQKTNIDTELSSFNNNDLSLKNREQYSSYFNNLSNKLLKRNLTNEELDYYFNNNLTQIDFLNTVTNSTEFLQGYVDVARSKDFKGVREYLSYNPKLPRYLTQEVKTKGFYRDMQNEYMDEMLELNIPEKDSPLFLDALTGETVTFVDFGKGGVEGFEGLKGIQAMPALITNRGLTWKLYLKGIPMQGIPLNEKKLGKYFPKPSTRKPLWRPSEETKEI